MFIAIFITTVVAALACLVGGLWLALVAMRHLFLGMMRSSQAGQLPVVESTLMVAAPLLIVEIVKLDIALVMACGLWAMSAVGA